MKNLIAVISFCLLVTSTAFAQKFGYVDTDYVLKHMLEYTEAQGELNRLSATWQEEIEAKYAAIALLEQSFQAEKILLTSEMKDRRQNEIIQKRTEAQQMQKQKFGVDGELFQMREQLVKPVQDKIYEAIQEVASSRGYMVIFDKSNNSNMLYTNPKYDLSDDVIKKMGYKPGDIIEDENAEDDKGAGSKGGGAGTKPGGNRQGGANTGSKGGNTAPKRK